MPDDTFTIEDSMLVSSAVPRRGMPYTQTCTKRVFDDVAYGIEKLGAATFSGETIQGRIGAPFTQVFVAFAFLKERGCIVPARGPGRRHKAADDFVYEDALIEWHALREGAPGSR